jgi:hypothetical protein
VDASGEGVRRIGFYDQVKVIALHREVHDTEDGAAGASEGACESLERAPRAKRR